MCFTLTCHTDVLRRPSRWHGWYSPLLQREIALRLTGNYNARTGSISLYTASEEQVVSSFFFFSFSVILQADGCRLAISFSARAQLTVCRKHEKEEPFLQNAHTSCAPERSSKHKVQISLQDLGGLTYLRKQLFARQAECLEEGIQFFILNADIFVHDSSPIPPHVLCPAKR